VTEQYASEILSLPMYAELGAAAIERVVATIQAALSNQQTPVEALAVVA
jgi:dTDP-4-amino-4,6-dideoxygalactose transaminase